MPITADEEVLSGQPRIAGTRIGVRHIYEMVITGDGAPATVADALDVSVGEVYEALAYYYTHDEEMQQLRATAETATAELEERVVKPTKRVDRSDV